MAAVAAPSYLDLVSFFWLFVTTLKTRGPAAWAAVQAVFVAIENLIAVLSPPKPAGLVGSPTIAAWKPSEAEQEAEKKLMAAMPADHPKLVGAGGLGMIELLRIAYQLMREYPEVWAMIQAILKRFVPTFGTIQG